MKKITTTEGAFELLQNGKRNLIIYGNESAVRRYVSINADVLACCVTELGAMNRGCISLKTLFEEGEDFARKCIAASSAFVLFEFEKLSAKRFDDVIQSVLAAKKGIRIILVGDLKARISCPANGNSSPVQADCWEGLEPDTLRIPIPGVDKDFSDAVDRIRNGDFEGALWLNEHCVKKCPDKAVQIVASDIEASRINKSFDRSKMTGPFNYSEGDTVTRCTFHGFIAGDIDKEELAIPFDLDLFTGEQIITVAPPLIENSYEFDCEVSTAYLEFMLDGPILAGQRKVNRYRSKLTYSTDEFGNGHWEYTPAGRYYQYNILPAHAVSLRQSELMTFANVKLNPTTTMPGELAALLSRCRSAPGTFLTRPIERDDLKFDAEIIKKLGK